MNTTDQELSIIQDYMRIGTKHERELAKMVQRHIKENDIMAEIVRQHEETHEKLRKHINELEYSLRNIILDRDEAYDEYLEKVVS